MNKSNKTLEKMRNNPRDWRIEEVKMIADHNHICYRHPGGSHVTFYFLNKNKLTIPAHKPIKPIYIRKFIALLDSQEEA